MTLEDVIAFLTAKGFTISRVPVEQSGFTGPLEPLWAVRLFEQPSTFEDGAVALREEVFMEADLRQFATDYGLAGASTGLHATAPVIEPPWWNEAVDAVFGTFDDMVKARDEYVNEEGEPDPQMGLFLFGQRFEQAFSYAKSIPGLTTTPTDVFFTGPTANDDATAEAQRRNAKLGTDEWYVTTVGGRTTINRLTPQRPAEPTTDFFTGPTAFEDATAVAQLRNAGLGTDEWYVDTEGGRTTLNRLTPQRPAAPTESFPAYFPSLKKALEWTKQNPGFVATIQNGRFTAIEGQPRSIEDEIDRLILAAGGAEDVDGDFLQKALRLDEIRDELNRPKFTLSFEKAVEIAFSLATTSQEAREYFDMLVGAREEFKALMSQEDAKVATEGDNDIRHNENFVADDSVGTDGTEIGEGLDFTEYTGIQDDIVDPLVSEDERLDGLPTEVTPGDREPFVPGMSRMTQEEILREIEQVGPGVDISGIADVGDAPRTPADEVLAAFESRERLRVSPGESATEIIDRPPPAEIPTISFNDLMARYSDIRDEKRRWDGLLNDPDSGVDFNEWDRNLVALYRRAQARYDAEFSNQTAAALEAGAQAPVSPPSTAGPGLFLSSAQAGGAMGAPGALAQTVPLMTEGEGMFSGIHETALAGAMQPTEIVTQNRVGGTGNGTGVSFTDQGVAAVDTPITPVLSPTGLNQGQATGLSTNAFDPTDTLFNIFKIVEGREKQRDWVKKGTPSVRFH